MRPPISLAHARESTACHAVTWEAGPGMQGAGRRGRERGRGKEEGGGKGRKPQKNTARKFRNLFRGPEAPPIGRSARARPSKGVASIPGPQAVQSAPGTSGLDGGEGAVRTREGEEKRGRRRGEENAPPRTAGPRSGQNKLLSTGLLGLTSGRRRVGGAVGAPQGAKLGAPRKGFLGQRGWSFFFFSLLSLWAWVSFF